MADSPDRCRWPESLDAMQAAPDPHKVRLGKEQVRVLEAGVAPGDSVPVHTHCGPSGPHALGVRDFVRRDPAGATLLDTRSGTPLPAVGSVIRSAPLAPHALTNGGACEVRVIAVGIKR